MNILHLTKDMLRYELAVRGMPTSDSNTVDQLRAAFRPLLKLEKKGKGLKNPAYPFNAEEELDTIAEVFAQALKLVKEISGAEARNIFERAQSRFMHLYQRLDRIPLGGLSADLIEKRAQLTVEVLSTLDQLDRLLASEPNLSSAFEQSVSDNESVLSDRIDRTAAHKSTPNKSFNGGSKNCRVDKWGLKFSGHTDKMSVHNFLERATELRLARGLSEAELFDSAIDLFSEKALNWFRANRDRFNDWQSLSELLTRHFEPPDYRARLFKEILDRTQDTSETIVDYLSNMNALFRRHGRLSADVQLDIITRNLSPFYTTQLPVVSTLEELESECLKLEAKKYRVDHYVPPSRRRRGFVEPDFAFIESSITSENFTPTTAPIAASYLPPSPTTFPTNVAAHLPQNSSFPRSNQADSASSGNHLNPRPNLAKCWNCDQTGHLNRNCPLPRKRHCYRCGTPDVTVSTCPKCRSGNASRRN